MAVLDKGARNVELLKQPQYSPMSVEKQIAIMFVGTHGLIRNVPINKVRNFEETYLHKLESLHPEILETLKQGVINEEIENKLTDLAKEVSKQFEEKK